MRNGGTRWLAAAAATAALLAASACVAMPQERTGAADAWKPPAPDRFLSKFQTTSNQAAEKRDLKLIQSVESGPLLKSTLAAYRIARKTDPEGTDKPGPVERQDSKIFMPKFDNYPLWFIDQSTVDSSTVYGLNLRVSAGDDWKRMVEVFADSGTIPEIDPAAQPVTTADKDKFARDATAIPRAYAGYAQNGSKALQAGAFATHSGTTALMAKLDDIAAKAARDKATYKRTVAPGVARTLATTDGGALVLFSMEEKVDLAPAAGKKLALDDEQRAYTDANDGASGSLKATYVWQVAAHVPAKGQNDDNVTILGVSRTLGTAELG